MGSCFIQVISDLMGPMRTKRPTPRVKDNNDSNNSKYGPIWTLATNPRFQNFNALFVQLPPQFPPWTYKDCILVASKIASSL